MRNMIHEALEKVVEDFKTKIDDSKLCHLKTIRYDNQQTPDYSIEEIQQLYLLRYYPAYLFEYMYIYKEILQNEKANKLSILSVGCGCCVDYHGAYLAKNRNYDDISYIGIDLNKWEYENSFGNPKFKTITSNIDNIEFGNSNKYNVVIFPKSISEFCEDSFNCFLDALSNTDFKQDCIFLISSSMTTGTGCDDDRYTKVLEVFTNKGFNCSPKYIEPQALGTRAINTIDGQFDYPNSIKDYITELSCKCQQYINSRENCKVDCKTQLDKQPMLRADYIRYQVNCLERQQ